MGQVAETGTKVCPYCSERVRAEAVKCRFCGEWFQDRTQPETAANRQSPPLENHDARPRPEAHTSGRAIASFLFALLGGGLGAIPAVVLGRQARQEIRNSEGSIKGDGWAYAGLVLGWTQLAVLGVVALVMMGNALSGSSAPPLGSNVPTHDGNPDGHIEVQVDEANQPGLVGSASAVRDGGFVYVKFTITRRPILGTCDGYTNPDGGHYSERFITDPGEYRLRIHGSEETRSVLLICV